MRLAYLDQQQVSYSAVARCVRSSIPGLLCHLDSIRLRNKYHYRLYMHSGRWGGCGSDKCSKSRSRKLHPSPYLVLRCITLQVWVAPHPGPFAAAVSRALGSDAAVKSPLGKAGHGRQEAYAYGREAQAAGPGAGKNPKAFCAGTTTATGPVKRGETV